MQRIKLPLLVILMSYFLFFVPQFSFGNSDIGWNIKAGDTMFYKVLDYYDVYDDDGDGNLDTRTMTITTNDSSLVNVTYTKGMQFTVRIISLEEPVIIQMIHDEIIEQPYQTTDAEYYWFFRPTIANLTYWVSFVNNSEVYSLEDDLLVEHHLDEEDGFIIEWKLKYDWKTGWLVYFLNRVENSTQLLVKNEYSSRLVTSTTGYTFLPIAVSLVLITVGITRYRKNRITSTKIYHD